MLPIVSCVLGGGSSQVRPHWGCVGIELSGSLGSSAPRESSLAHLKPSGSGQGGICCAYWEAYPLLVEPPSHYILFPDSGAYVCDPRAYKTGLGPEILFLCRVDCVGCCQGPGAGQRSVVNLTVCSSLLPPPRCRYLRPFINLTEVVRASSEVRSVKGKMRKRPGLVFPASGSFSHLKFTRGPLISLQVAPHPSLFLAPQQKSRCMTQGGARAQSRDRPRPLGLESRDPSPSAPAGPGGWLGLSPSKDSCHPTI